MTDQEVSRRRLIGASVGLGVTVVAGGVGFYVARENPPTKPGVNAPVVPTTAAGGGVAGLAAVDSIPDGGGIILDAQEIVLTRTGSEVHCFTAVCPHQQCLVSAVDGGRITCPCHGSAFDANTGAVVNGPATVGLDVIAVKVQDGQVVPG